MDAYIEDTKLSAGDTVTQSNGKICIFQGTAPNSSSKILLKENADDSMPFMASAMLFGVSIR